MEYRPTCTSTCTYFFHLALLSLVILWACYGDYDNLIMLPSNLNPYNHYDNYYYQFIVPPNFTLFYLKPDCDPFNVCKCASKVHPTTYMLVLCLDLAFTFLGSLPLNSFSQRET